VVRHPLLLLAAAMLALVSGGCASTHTVARDLTVMNQPDAFSLHIGSVEGFSRRLDYKWENSGAKALVRQASSITAGGARLEVRDAGGRMVHEKSLAEVGSYPTAEGKPGAWRVTLVLSRATGSVTFELAKR
jgi:hypothetical protein